MKIFTFSAQTTINQTQSKQTQSKQLLDKILDISYLRHNGDLPTKVLKD